MDWTIPMGGNGLSKEFIGILALALTLVGAIFGFGQKLGSMSTSLEEQAKRIVEQRDDLKGVRLDLNGTRLELTRALSLYEMQIRAVRTHEEDEDQARGKQFGESLR